MVTKGHSHPIFDVAYKYLMRRNSVYVAFILGGALVGERVLDNTINTLWDQNNKGKLYKDIEGSFGSGGGDDEGGDE
ncbi:hypothetical protein WJX73_002445 [Symbiochloris irregularis]|uniref:Complex III subunit 9 n=1 Tax=Symbiochloris irregularis TaxID=706552 RepID=A0AAW1PC33_9CHLO